MRGMNTLRGIFRINLDLVGPNDEGSGHSNSGNSVSPFPSYNKPRCTMPKMSQQQMKSAINQDKHTNT